MDTVAVYTALKLRRNCFLYASPESCPCTAASLPGSPRARSACTDVPATPPPAWPSRMGNWEQRRELTLEIPTGRGKTEACSKVGVTETQGEPQPGEYISPDAAPGGRQGAGATPIPTPREAPGGSSQSHAQTHTPDFLLSSGVSPGDKCAQQISRNPVTSSGHSENTTTDPELGSDPSCSHSAFPV